MGMVTIKRCLFTGKNVFSGKYGKHERRPLLPTHANDSTPYSAPQNTTSSPSTGGGWISPRMLSDIIIGLSDGLTVPFALTAGLSSLGQTRVVITGGLAELVAGAISMGLGGYLAATGELEYYMNQVEQEHITLNHTPDHSLQSLRGALSTFSLSGSTVD